jgi:D-arabinose 1-dehydrogenase-like Zn-dependent alcohol dehydrogenase
MSAFYPLVVGHEIVGEVVRAGPMVEGGLKVGDIVGIGAQSDSCLKCARCRERESPPHSPTTSLPVRPNTSG